MYPFPRGGGLTHKALGIECQGTETQVSNPFSPAFRLPRPSCSNQGCRPLKGTRRKHSSRTECMLSSRQLFTDDLASRCHFTPLPLPSASVPHGAPYGGGRVSDHNEASCSDSTSKPKPRPLDSSPPFHSALSSQDQREVGVGYLLWGPGISLFSLVLFCFSSW